VTGLLLYRTLLSEAQPWRQIIKLTGIDGCPWLNGVDDNALELMKELRKIYKNTFPGLPEKCPIQRGTYSTNTTNLPPNADKDADIRAGMVGRGVAMPNGNYKLIFKFALNNNNEVLTVVFQLSQDDRLVKEFDF
jgi:hypothetical protein